MFGNADFICICKLYFRSDKVSQNYFLKIGVDCATNVSWILSGFEDCLYVFFLVLFLFISFASVTKIKDSLCLFNLEHFFLMSQFRFQLDNYILPISDSSVISIGYGILHSLFWINGVALGIVQSLPSSPIFMPLLAPERDMGCFCFKRPLYNFVSKLFVLFPVQIFERALLLQ